MGARIPCLGKPEGRKDGEREEGGREEGNKKQKREEGGRDEACIDRLSEKEGDASLSPSPSLGSATFS